MDRFPFQRDGDWLHVNQRFGNFYMTLLATQLSQTHGLGLLTDSAPNDRLANASRLGAQYSILNLSDHEFGHYGRRSGIENQPRQLAEGALAELIMKGVDINPRTSVRKILEFRKSYADELGFLRTKVAELTKTFEDDQPLDALIQRVNDTYVNEFVPQLNAFKKALTASKIKWAAENLLKVSFFSTASTSVPLALLGLSVPYALLVGAGVSLTVAAALYNHERIEKLSSSPFSYVMAAEKKLRR